MDYSLTTIRSTLHALEVVIGPVVNASGDGQARDQLDLSIDALRFLESRIPHLCSRAAFSLRTALDLAERLREDVAGETVPLAELICAMEAANRVLKFQTPTLSELEAATAGLTGATREILRLWALFADDAIRLAVAKDVLHNEGRRIEADRAWFAPLGFDPRPETIRAMEEVLQ